MRMSSVYFFYYDLGLVGFISVGYDYWYDGTKPTITYQIQQFHSNIRIRPSH